MFPLFTQSKFRAMMLCACIMLGQGAARAEIGMTCPGAAWEVRQAESVKLADAHLDTFIRNVGGDGCIVKDGYMIRAWGKQNERSSWFSAAKPVLSTLLMLAVAENRLPGVDAPVAAAGWQLRPSDRAMTFRHLANMVSGYARAEPPGVAWAYNDFAIQLHGLSLRKIYGAGLGEVLRTRLSALQFEDKPAYGGNEELVLHASLRDFARIGWFWLNRGVWQGRPIIPRKLFDQCVRVGVPDDMPRTSAPDEDYLGVGSFGGGSDQVEHGPGVYGFGFWFNAQLPGSSHRMWPSLPRTSFQANGIWNKYTVTMIPDWRMVVVVRNGLMGRFEPGVAESKTDKKFSLLRPTHSAALRGAHKH